MRDIDISMAAGQSSSDFKQAWDHHEKGEYDEAIALYESGLKENPDKTAYYDLARVYQAKDDVLKAIQAVTEAVKIDKLFHEAFALMGDLYFSKRQGFPAIESYGQAVAINPDNLTYKKSLIKVASSFKFKRANPNLKGVLIECMEDDQVDMYLFGGAWLSLVMKDASVGPFYKLSKMKSYKAFKKGMDAFPNCDGLIDPFFLTGFGKFTVADIAFETWCKYLRRYLIEAIVEGRILFTDPDDIELITCALSRYCLLTDYIMHSDEEEKVLVDEICQRVSKSNTPKLEELACLGCYEHIYLLDNAMDIAQNLAGGDHVSQIPKSQIEDFAKQQDIKKTLGSLTAIDDKTSERVREQYELFPYPRWVVPAKDLINEDIEGDLRDQKIKILNAGCGTGKEAIQMSYVLPNAEITAVDLSKTSLAYAQMKANELGIENIKFLHGDIMELGALDEKFDYIASAGVLHYLKDPLEGWKVLNGLLKPQGLMRIALYSRHARWAINEARAVIERKEIGSDSQSIKDFRDNIRDHLKYKSIKKLEELFDYYNLPECRDLLFHVQEHQYDLPLLKKQLDELGLEFLQFRLAQDKIDKYKKQNPQDANATDLESWAKWEEKNPDLFISMYTFWCRKI
jgi:ubiquinone/menaquinone biosynthesis C-methylase UbiE